MMQAERHAGEEGAGTATGANANPSGPGLVHRAGGSDGPSYLPEPVSAHAPSLEAGVHQAPAKASCGSCKAEAASTAAVSDTSSRFICHICLNSPEKPVVTVCGHLYCWGCLFKWLNLHRDDPQCPVCKAGIQMPEGDPSKAKVVPLYVGDETSDPRNTVPEDPTVPQRPPGERPESQRMAGGMGAFGPGGLAGYPQIVANIGLFPSLFGLAFQSPGMGPGPTGFAGVAQGVPPNEAAERAQAAQAAIQQHEAAQQEFLSRLLFMIGTFIALCLIFFP